MCCIERGADYEFRLSAKNLVDYGQTAVQTLRTPDGSKSKLTDLYCRPARFYGGVVVGGRGGSMGPGNIGPQICALIFTCT